MQFAVSITGVRDLTPIVGIQVQRQMANEMKPGLHRGSVGNKNEVIARE